MWSLTLQTSMIDPQRLGADGWLALLAALVTASGYTWQPAFFNRKS